MREQDVIYIQILYVKYLQVRMRSSLFVRSPWTSNTWLSYDKCSKRKHPKYVNVFNITIFQTIIRSTTVPFNESFAKVHASRFDFTWYCHR